MSANAPGDISPIRPLNPSARAPFTVAIRRISLAGTEERIARILLKERKVDSALKLYQKGLAILEPLSLGDKPNLEAVYAVMNEYFGLGETYGTLAKGSINSGKRAELLKQSCAFYEKSEAELRRIPEWLPITPNEFDSRTPHEIGAALASCHAGAKTEEP